MTFSKMTPSIITLGIMKLCLNNTKDLTQHNCTQLNHTQYHGIKYNDTQVNDVKH